MGCWNGTCAISNLHIKSGEDVAVMMLGKAYNVHDFCYTTSLYHLVPIMFYGQYNDYGAVEKCHGVGVDMVVNALKNNLFEMEQGDNQYHDIPVKKETFNIEQMFEADHENRLGINDPDHFSQETFRRMTHIMIKQSVLDNLLEHHMNREYLGYDKKSGTSQYRDVYFKDVVNDIPEYAKSMMKKFKKDKYITLEAHGPKGLKSNLAERFMGYMGVSSMRTVLIRPFTLFNDMLKNGVKEQELCVIMEDMLKIVWLDTFMSATRKVWSKQSGEGSQRDDYDAYELLANTILKIVVEEKAEREADH